MCNERRAGLRARAAMLALLVLAAVAMAHGTTLARMSLDQLAAAAQVVARVRCTGAESRRENDSIWTYTIFTVEETFKGAPDAQITVRLPGGRDGHLVQSVEGAPQFTEGEEAIVFLERTRSGDWSISAWAEGTFRVARDAAANQETVTQDSSGMAVFDPATRTFRTEGIARMPLENFREKLNAAIESVGR